MKPLFSIIIPHYDIPDLLMRCLKSIPVSKEIQVIVVDDNSPEADTYLEKYPELSRPYLEFIRTTKGGGAGYARNIGLEHAKGEWLLFADADD
ncbi:MAG: glycosyltransferase family 2 protein, partial [Lachnospiraceae bacterium]|nr:glycosyltransferase family 2 protein [Lachnospiraceae bacterium]